MPGQQLFVLVEVVDGRRQIFCLDPEGDHTVRAQLAGHFLGQDNIVAAVGAGECHLLRRRDDFGPAGDYGYEQ